MGTICGQLNWQTATTEPVYNAKKKSIGDEQNGTIFIGRNFTQIVAKKWKWFSWWQQISVSYLKTWWEPKCIGRTKRRNLNGGGGGLKTPS